MSKMLLQIACTSFTLFFELWSVECAIVLRTDVVFLLAGDGVAANLSVLDGRQVPDDAQQKGN